MRIVSVRDGGSIARIGGLAVSLLLLAACAAGSSNPAAPQRSATLARGALISSVNATGNIQAEAQFSIGFDQPGTVAVVNVKAGDWVKKGDVLAKLDGTDLELALAQARTAVIVANAAYSRTVDGPRQADVDAAQAALNAAYAAYDKLKTGPQPEDTASVQAALLNAQATLKQAQNAYDRARATKPAGIGGAPESLQLEQATNAYNAARASYDRAAKGPDGAQLASAVQQIDGALASLDRLKQPVKSFDLEAAEAQRRQAQLQMDQAARQVQRAALLAPADGVVSAINAQTGETVGTQPVVTLADLSRLHIDITVDEIDVARIKQGQEVAVALDALPEVQLKGTVDRIAPTSTTNNGVVSYLVRVLLQRADAGLKTGMTANTAIVLERHDNALLVPNWALRRDAGTGKSYLTFKVDDKTAKEVEVKPGLRNETTTEILSGASEGQVVLAPQTSGLFGP